MKRLKLNSSQFRTIFYFRYNKIEEEEEAEQQQNNENETYHWIMKKISSCVLLCINERCCILFLKVWPDFI